MKEDEEKNKGSTSQSQKVFSSDSPSKSSNEDDEKQTEEESRPHKTFSSDKGRFKQKGTYYLLHPRFL